MIKNVTAITVNYKTKDLIETSLIQFRKYYPDIQLIIVDGSSFDESSEWIYEFAKKDKKTRVLFNNFNIHHGPGMDTGLRLVRTPYSFLFDTDTNIVKDGMIEKMLNMVAFNQDFYSIGTLHNINDYGFDIMPPYNGLIIQNVTKIKERDKGIHYIHPRAKLLNNKQYFQFFPFIKHGAPCAAAYKSLQKANKQNLLFHFPVLEYIVHPDGKGGTVAKSGLGLYTKKELEAIKAKQDKAKENQVLKLI